MAIPLPTTKDPIAAEIIQVTLTALRASAALFYWIDNRCQMIEICLEGAPEGLYRDYAGGMEMYDPSNVARMVAGGRKVTQLTQLQAHMVPGAENFSRFLHGWGAADVFDLVFRADGGAIGGIGVLKMHRDPPACEHDLATAGAVHRYIEFTLQYHERVMRQRARARMTQDKLTGRELEVAVLVTEGLTNNEISKRLKLSLPTVKSHLTHIFEKCDCTNRVQLAARLHDAYKG